MFKVRIKFEKNEYSAYISHLDLMNTLQRSLVRAKLPVRYTEGFNPHIYLSILVPLSTGYQSQCELADFDLTTDTLPEEEEVLPWDHIFSGVCKSYLWSEYQQALKGVATPDCAAGCRNCGALTLSCGRPCDV